MPENALNATVAIEMKERIVMITSQVSTLDLVLNSTNALATKLL